MTEKRPKRTKLYLAKGTEAPWYTPQKLTDEERQIFRIRSRQSQLASLAAKRGVGPRSVHPIYHPRLNPAALMPSIDDNGLSALSLFSGGGGLDLGFLRAGFRHIASYEILDFAAETLKTNHPDWQVHGGPDGDVTEVDWRTLRGDVDVVHGGPPCQPFSTAGRQRGDHDARDMFPEFVRAVLQIEPRAFVAENVLGLKSKKFSDYIAKTVIDPLAHLYEIRQFVIHAASFGVPQHRRRIFVIGTHRHRVRRAMEEPYATHDWSRYASNRRGGSKQLDLLSSGGDPTMGTREALGLPDIGLDELAPTIRCSLTGPRSTTSILSSTAALRVWHKLQIWPNGVAASKEAAKNYPAKNDHYRLSVEDCAILQGFPSYWKFSGPVYKVLGQIGNSVAPPVAYNVAKRLAEIIAG